MSHTGFSIQQNTEIEALEGRAGVLESDRDSTVLRLDSTVVRADVLEASLAAKAATTVVDAKNDTQDDNIVNSKSRLVAIEEWLEKLNEGYTVEDSNGNDVPFTPVVDNEA